MICVRVRAVLGFSPPLLNRICGAAQPQQCAQAQCGPSSEEAASRAASRARRRRRGGGACSGVAAARERGAATPCLLASCAARPRTLSQMPLKVCCCCPAPLGADDAAALPSPVRLLPWPVLRRLASRPSRVVGRVGGRLVLRSSAAAGASTLSRSRCSAQPLRFRMSSCEASSRARSRGHLWAPCAPPSTGVRVPDAYC